MSACSCAFIWTQFLKNTFFVVKMARLCETATMGTLQHTGAPPQSPGEPHSDVTMSFGSDHRPQVSSTAFVWLSRAKGKRE